MSKCFCEIQVPRLSQSGREGVPNDQWGGIGHTHTNITVANGSWAVSTPECVNIVREASLDICLARLMLGEEEK